MSRKEALSQFINQIHGRAVVVKLNSGVDYRGKHKIKIFHKFEKKTKKNFSRHHQLPINLLFGQIITSLYSIGVLACLDGYMNIALDQTEEYQNGQLKNKYGDAFIRGNNVLYISTSKTLKK